MLNSSPIDEPGEGAYESGWWHAGIHGNPESGNHHQAPSHWETQWRYFTNLYTYHGQPWEREGEGQTAAQMHKI